MHIGNKLNKKFEEVFEKVIDAKLDECEQFRLKQKKMYNIYPKILIVILISFSPCILIFAKDFNKSPFFGLYIYYLTIVVPLLFCLFVLIFTKLKSFKKRFRDAIKKPLLEPFLSLFGDFKLSNRKLLLLCEIYGCGFFPKITHKKDDDNIIGIYNGTPIAFCETKLWHIPTDYGFKLEVIDFFGLIVKIKLKQKYTCSLAGIHKVSTNALIKIIHNASKKYYNLISPKFAQELNDIGANNAYSYSSLFDNDENKDHEINLPEIKINKFSDKGFSFFSNDPDNLDPALYKILQPTLIEIINDICTSTISNGFRFIIKDDYAYLFISSQNLVFDSGYNERISSYFSDSPVKIIGCRNSFFEVGSMDYPLTNKKLCREVFYKLLNDLNSIFAFVDYLKECDLA